MCKCVTVYTRIRVNVYMRTCVYMHRIHLGKHSPKLQDIDIYIRMNIHIYIHMRICIDPYAQAHAQWRLQRVSCVWCSSAGFWYSTKHTHIHMRTLTYAHTHAQHHQDCKARLIRAVCMLDSHWHVMAAQHKRQNVFTGQKSVLQHLRVAGALLQLDPVPRDYEVYTELGRGGSTGRAAARRGIVFRFTPTSSTGPPE